MLFACHSRIKKPLYNRSFTNSNSRQCKRVLHYSVRLGCKLHKYLGAALDQFYLPTTQLPMNEWKPHPAFPGRSYKLKLNKALDKIPVLELWGIGASPAIWDHSVTCHPTQVNAPCLNPSWYSIYLPQRDGRLSWTRLSVSGNAPARSQTRNLSITSPTP